MVIGVGIDLVEIDRIGASIERWGEKFLRKIFSAGEIDYCSRRPYPARHFAARFAAKEAFLKGMGIGLFSGIALRDVEVHVLDSGKPELVLRGEAGELAAKNGVSSLNLSLSHSNRYATALVILEK